MVPKRKKRQRIEVDEATLQERIIQIKRVTKVRKGGKTLRFTALVVVGDGNGKVGLALGKAREVPDAIKKAIEKAKKNIIEVPIFEGRTVPHEVFSKFCSSRVLLKPAKPGHGIVGGNVVRAILELAGFKDLTTKVLGSSTPINVARATMKALASLRSPENIARRRGIDVEDLIKWANL